MRVYIAYRGRYRGGGRGGDMGRDRGRVTVGYWKGLGLEGSGSGSS